jgi:hypothetical protein
VDHRVGEQGSTLFFTPDSFHQGGRESLHRLLASEETRVSEKIA